MLMFIPMLPPHPPRSAALLYFGMMVYVVLGVLHEVRPLCESPLFPARVVCWAWRCADPDLFPARPAAQGTTSLLAPTSRVSRFAPRVSCHDGSTSHHRCPLMYLPLNRNRLQHPLQLVLVLWPRCYHSHPHPQESQCCRCINGSAPLSQPLSCLACVCIATLSGLRHFRSIVVIITCISVL
ncbi:hypothetical protein JB92DRAFT_729505 [Gautieria morchelliformis]|nr:hypothetical protein JB92DRAFT_729505 [Gautieria morchelliformis]